LGTNGYKLVATESGAGPVGRQHGAEFGGDLVKGLIAGVVSVGVVELLEVVDIEERTVDLGCGAGS